MASRNPERPAVADIDPPCDHKLHGMREDIVRPAGVGCHAVWDQFSGGSGVRKTGTAPLSRAPLRERGARFDLAAVLFEILLDLKGGHAAGAGGGDGLAIAAVLDVAAGKDAGDRLAVERRE